MDNNYPITDQIELVAAHLRLIADLMLTGADLKEVDLPAFALVMEDLAVRLEEAIQEKMKEIIGEQGMDRESQP